MEVNRSGYYRHLKQAEAEAKTARLENVLMMEVTTLHKQSGESYGSRRIAKGLQEKGYPVGRYQARSLMRKGKIHCKQRRRFKVTTQNNPTLAVAENKLNRAFTVRQLNRVWAADITYLWTQEGWLYLSVVLDLCSRRVIGWSLSIDLREELVDKALRMAISRRRPGEGVMHHSDRGCQYASHAYQQLLKEHGMIGSMSRKGNCWDNAVMERFFGSLKSERVSHKKYATRAEAKADVVDYIEMFYNSKRMHSALGYLSPMQYENQISRKAVSTFT